jgi:DNA-binding CsgD family transcriptional regulator
MIEELIGINEITFNISDDALNFQTIITISRSSIELALRNNKTLFSIINTIFNSARQVFNERKIHYRLNIFFENLNITMTDSVSEGSIYSLGKIDAAGILEKSKAIKQFSSLTKKEKEVLLLISKKIKQAIIISDLKISLNTFKTHKRRIYFKMEFKDRDDLLEWAKLHSDIFE